MKKNKRKCPWNVLIYLPVVFGESFFLPQEKCANREIKLPTVEHKNLKRLRKFDNRYPAIPSTRNFPVFYPTRDLSIPALGQSIPETIKSIGLQSWSRFFLPYADGHNRYRWRPNIYIKERKEKNIIVIIFVVSFLSERNAFKLSPLFRFLTGALR